MHSGFHMGGVMHTTMTSRSWQIKDVDREAVVFAIHGVAADGLRS